MMKICPYCYGYLNDRRCDTHATSTDTYAHYFNYNDGQLNIYLNYHILDGTKLQVLYFSRHDEGGIWQAWSSGDKTFLKIMKALTRTEIDKVIKTYQLLV